MSITTRHTRRLRHRVAVLLLTAALGWAGATALAAPASATAIPVKGACNPPSGTAPRGEACAYLIWDAATSKFAAQGVVNPRNGHTWRVRSIEVWTCTWSYDYCSLSPAHRGPFEYTRTTMKVPSGSALVYCGGAIARMVYEVDYTDTFAVQTEGYSTGVGCPRP